MTGDLDPQLDGEAIGEMVPRLVHAVGRRRAIRGWATVELDRAEREIFLTTPALETFRNPEAPSDDLLGAKCRLGNDGLGPVMLLEPTTEGRLAAALARHGEGFLVLYLIVGNGADERAGAAGFSLSTEAGGPFGPQRLVLGGPRHGPFLMLAGFD